MSTRQSPAPAITDPLHVDGGMGMLAPRLGEKDLSVMRHGFENAKHVLREAGATDIYKTWYLAAHPGGTVKIGELVDSNLKTPIDNLYVCDCSVIPESFGMPPTLTLVALGKRLARHLVAEKDPVERATAPPVAEAVAVAD